MYSICLERTNQHWRSHNFSIRNGYLTIHSEEETSKIYQRIINNNSADQQQGWTPDELICFVSERTYVRRLRAERWRGMKTADGNCRTTRGRGKNIRNQKLRTVIEGIGELFTTVHYGIANEQPYAATTIIQNFHPVCYIVATE